MSIAAMMHVWWHSPSSGNDRLVLLAIADEADDEGRNAFPGIRRIATKVRCHPETVTECIKRLEAAGELIVTRPEKQGRGHFNTYRLVMERVGVSDPSGESNARIAPRKSADLGGEKRGPIRANPIDPSTDPAKRTKSFPQPSGWKPEERTRCDDCDGTTMLPNAEGLYDPTTPCPVCTTPRRASA